MSFSCFLVGLHVLYFITHANLLSILRLYLFHLLFLSIEAAFLLCTKALGSIHVNALRQLGPKRRLGHCVEDGLVSLPQLTEELGHQTGHRGRCLHRARCRSGVTCSPLLLGSPFSPSFLSYFHVAVDRTTEHKAQHWISGTSWAF